MKLFAINFIKSLSSFHDTKIIISEQPLVIVMSNNSHHFLQILHCAFVYIILVKLKLNIILDRSAILVESREFAVLTAMSNVYFADPPAPEKRGSACCQMKLQY